jgi:redox-sensing transcriptional repressor
MKRGQPRSAPVSDLITQRLSLYLRCLEELDHEGIVTVSSQSLAERYRLSSAQIRKDLATFGEFGVRGVGYAVSELRQRLTHILGLDRDLKVAIVGAGNLGMALADYGGFNREGFRIAALFDVAPEKIGGTCRNGAPILHISQLGTAARQMGVQIVVVAVPASAAQSVIDAAAAAGIPAALNFAPVRIQAPPRMSLRNVDLKIQLESLAFRLVSTRRAPALRQRGR